MRSLVALVFALGICLWAQTSNTGTVVGLTRATHPAALVSGAVVELEDSAAKLLRSAVTNAAGRYAFVGVPPGTFGVKASAKGFQQAVMNEVAVEVRKSYTIDLQLTLRSVATGGGGGQRRRSRRLQTLDSDRRQASARRRYAAMAAHADA